MLQVADESVKHVLDVFTEKTLLYKCHVSETGCLYSKTDHKETSCISVKLVDKKNKLKTG